MEPVAERLDDRLLARPDGQDAAQVAHRVAFEEQFMIEKPV
jgi:hypothetical protein